MPIIVTVGRSSIDFDDLLVEVLDLKKLLLDQNASLAEQRLLAHQQKSAISKHETTISEQRSQISQLETTITEQQTTNDAMKDEISALKTSLAQQHTEDADLQTQLTSLKADVITAQQVSSSSPVTSSLTSRGAETGDSGNWPTSGSDQYHHGLLYYYNQRCMSVQFRKSC